MDMKLPNTFANRILAKTASARFLANLLGSQVEKALPPETGSEPEEKKDPLVNEQGVINVPKHHQLSPEQLEHMMHRIFYNPKHKELAEEIKAMTTAQAGARPFVVG